MHGTVGKGKFPTALALKAGLCSSTACWHDSAAVTALFVKSKTRYKQEAEMLDVLHMYTSPGPASGPWHCYCYCYWGVVLPSGLSHEAESRRDDEGKHADQADQSTSKRHVLYLFRPRDRFFMGKDIILCTVCSTDTFISSSWVGCM
jgi:hypothetical protein